jgi:hypothetical protein
VQVDQPLIEPLILGIITPLPPGKAWSSSAPLPATLLEDSNLIAPLTLFQQAQGPPPVPTIEFAGVPKIKYDVQTEQLGRPLALGTTLPPLVIPLPLGQQQSFVDTPHIPADPLGFMAASVIGPAGNPPGSSSVAPTIEFMEAPKTRIAISADEYLNRLPLLMPPPPGQLVSLVSTPHVQAHPMGFRAR